MADRCFCSEYIVASRCYRTSSRTVVTLATNSPAKTAKTGEWTIEIIKRSDTAKGFVLLPRRWVVERTLAWLNRNRRLAKDFEATIESATAWVYLASVQLLTRKIARY